METKYKNTPLPHIEVGELDEDDGRRFIRDEDSARIEELTRDGLLLSSPSDCISITAKTDQMLIDLWTFDKPKFHTIPTDLLFSKTIPIWDMIIRIDEQELGMGIAEARICIFKEVVEAMLAYQMAVPVVVGCISWKMPIMGMGNVLIPLFAEWGIDSFLTAPYAYWDGDERFEQSFYDNVPVIRVMRYLMDIMSTWYGIQIALLHPQIKNCIRRGGKEKVKYSGKRKDGNVVRITEYIKRKYIGPEDFQKAAGDKKYTRHCLAWYVCGHWRAYKDGRKKFIQGYWKGLLREARKNFDEGRTRLIPQTDKKEDKNEKDLL